MRCHRRCGLWPQLASQHERATRPSLPSPFSPHPSSSPNWLPRLTAWKPNFLPSTMHTSLLNLQRSGSLSRWTTSSGSSLDENISQRGTSCPSLARKDNFRETFGACILLLACTVRHASGLSNAVQCRTPQHHWHAQAGHA